MTLTEDRARPPLGRLENRTTLVTGSSSGLGAHFARVLAAAGARVILAARRTDRLQALAAEIHAAGGQAFAVGLDVTDTAGIDQAIDQGEAALGPIDILVNNSGVSVTRRLGEYTEADYDAVMDTNLKGAFFVAQAVGRRMVDRAREGALNGARIINIASAAGLKPLGQLAVYSMSKAAVVQMTRAMALEWGRFGINVNALCPGYIETDINREHWQTEAGQRLLARLPRRRLGQPEDLDGLLLLLAGGASGFVNGAVIATDDGLSVA
jgi:NAD(P)-dependent dehydrogenase (short-subunit alcohol dehydrogenase family)